MSVGAAFLVLDPPIDRLALLVEYIQSVVDEIVIVVDDRTKPDLIEKMRALPKVKALVPWTWNDSFADARNAALPHLTTDWVLHLDPDELPSGIMLAHIKWVSDGNANPATLGYLYWTVNYWDGVRGDEQPYHWHCRMFRRESGHWYRRVHELVMLGGLEEGQTRETVVLPTAPKEAYLIHSKPGSTIPESDALYARLGEVSR